MDVSTPWRIVSWRILIWRFVIDPPKRQIKVPAKFTGYTVLCNYFIHVQACTQLMRETSLMGASYWSLTTVSG